MAQTPNLRPKLSYEPNLIAGGAMGAVMALLVYYKIVDLEAAGLWSMALVAVAPVLQGWFARFFTTSTAKLADAGIHPDTVTAKAKAGRIAKTVAEEAMKSGPRP